MNNKPNRNLLDNWYFVGGGTNGKFPVNQRGQTSYTSLGFTVDRWYMGYVVVSKVLKMELLSDGLQISASMCVDSDVIDLHQNLVNGAALEGKTVTVSVLMVDGQLYQASFPFLQQATPIPLKQGLSFLSVPAQNLIIRSTPIGGSISNSIAAVKLELGSQQTLAHQDEDGNWVLNEIPDYGEELAKCQRYCYVLDGSPNNPQFRADVSADRLIGEIPFPVTMRTTPSVSMFPLTLRYTTTGATIVVSSAQLFVTNAGLSLIYQIQVSEGGPLVDGDIYSPNSKIIFSADL